MSHQLSIVIPAYNEAERIGASLIVIFDYLNRQGENVELIVVDDGSRDRTASVVETVVAQCDTRFVSARVIRVEPNRGKGHAVRAGLLAANAPIAIFMDADLSTPIDELPKLVAPIRAGRYDLVFGSRALDRDLVGVRQPWMREQCGRVFNLLMRIQMGLQFNDSQCGFKAFRMDVCRPLVEGSVIDRFGFDVELLYVAQLAGLRLHECAVRWNDVLGSKVSIRSGLNGFAELRRVRLNARQHLYDRAIENIRAAIVQAGTPTNRVIDATQSAPALAHEKPLVRRTFAGSR